VCVLAHVLETAGIATVALASVLPVAEQMHPPRALYCEFPLGRPLGVPGDAALQHAVLRRAFALLDAPSGPVLDTYPDVISADDAQPMACELPPRYDPSVPAAVDEATALLPAYQRSRAARGTSVGRTTDGRGIPAAVGALVRIADGTPWTDAGLPGDPISVAHDVRSYYEEVAIELAAAPPHAGGAEAWFYEQTEAGHTLLAARRAMKDSGAPFALWLYMARATRR
jgi:hypothetical protein